MLDTLTHFLSPLPNDTLSLFSLRGKIAVVVGGEGLLGKIIIETIGNLGGKVISLDRKVGANYVRDFRDYNKCQEIAGNISRCDILVNAAIGNQKVVTFPMSCWKDDLENGLTVAANCITAFTVHLREAKGVVLNIGSDLSLVAPRPDRYGELFKPVSYSVVKHGIVGLTKYYAAFWGRDGVRVNCLCPGGIDQGQKIPDCPMGRLARPEEMKGPVAFLISAASSYMTGAVVSVDGGSTVW